MDGLSYDQLKDRVARGKLGGSFFLDCEDPFLRDEAIRCLIEAHLDGGSADFDLDQTSAEDVDAEGLASRLATPPMLSRFRVIVVQRAQGLTPTARAVVEDAVLHPVEGRVLIVAAEVPKGSKAKFYAVLRKHCTLVSLRSPRLSELPGWLVERARSVHGVELEVAAAQVMATGVGPRPGILAQELEKLVTGVERGGKVGLEEVRATLSVLPQVDRWGWVDQVVDGQLGRALAVLPALLDSGERAVGLIGSLAEAFIRVGLAREGEDVLAGVLKRDGSYGYLKWKVRIYAQQARRWTKDGIAAALAELLRADRLIKSGGLSERTALEEALLRIEASRNGDGQEAVTGSAGARG